MTTPTDTASTARRQVHRETLETIAEQVGKFELAIARMANDPAMDVGQAPELLGQARNRLGDVCEMPREARRDVIEGVSHYSRSGSFTQAVNMPLIFDKILGLLAMPIGLAATVGILGWLALVLGRRRTAAVLLAFGLIWLWSWSAPLTGNAVIDSLSSRYPPQRAETSPEAGAIVVLGGGIRPVSGDLIYPDIDAAADRFLHAARLYHAGKAPLIVVSAGNPWSEPHMQSEADASRVLLNALGVPQNVIVTESDSRNTRQNAIFTAGLVADRGIRRILLVTSAWHMPRAVAAFRQTALEVIPAAADYAYIDPAPLILMILPQADGLALSTRALKEYLGLLVYRLRGWA